ncbi:nitrilase-related carbon-nitrogen hydrolase [Pseudocolwellia sp. HL-MZ19]|uniref:nitrilase-related carbon-nitrogen hydrolase n=1 Tax=unclassified Pseudocolwellia TaxID=2848178 RepID=UPI003CE947F4
MRVAVTQYATSLNIEENLATCIRIITQAASCKPDVIVLPAFCNTQQVIDQNDKQLSEHESAFVQALSEQAKQHECYLVAHLNLQPSQVDDVNLADTVDKLKHSGTSCLISPSGELIEQGTEILTTPQAKLGLLANDDILTFEPARSLALAGAELLCYSHRSFSLDQSNIHAPTRACENKVFLALSNQIGPLVDEGLQAENSIPEQHFNGVGQSQIISPNGKILAKLDHNEEGFTFADILFNTVQIEEDKGNNKLRPDGSDIFKQRRPELYQQSISTGFTDNSVSVTEPENTVPETVNVALFATYKTTEQAIEDVCFYIENNLSDIIQLPELFFIEDKIITHDPKQLAELEVISQQIIERVSAELRPHQYVCTSLIIDGSHQGVIISEQGAFATQQQLHFCERYKWTPLGNKLNIIELSLEQGNITLAILTADDANIAEIVNVAVLNKVHLLLVPFDIQEPSEVEFSLLSRAAEHRICIVASSREKDFASKEVATVNTNTKNQNQNKKKVKPQKSTGLVADLLSREALNSHLSTAHNSRKFSGYINQPLVKHQHGKITKSLIHPRAACEK